MDNSRPLDCSVTTFYWIELSISFIITAVSNKRKSKIVYLGIIQMVLRIPFVYAFLEASGIFGYGEQKYQGNGEDDRVP